MQKYAKRKKFIIALTILTGVVFSLITGCSKSDEQTTSKQAVAEVKVAEKSTKPIVFNVNKIPRTIDPALSTDSAAGRIQAAYLEGLVRLGKKLGKLYPELQNHGKSVTMAKNGYSN